MIFLTPMKIHIKMEWIAILIHSKSVKAVLANKETWKWSSFIR
jgi:hypothetical protein